MEDTHNFSNSTADNMEPFTEMSMKNGELEIIKSKSGEPCTRHTVHSFMNVLPAIFFKLDNSYRVENVLFHDQLGIEDSKQKEDTRKCSNGIAGVEVLNITTHYEISSLNKNNLISSESLQRFQEWKPELEDEDCWLNDEVRYL